MCSPISNLQWWHLEERRAGEDKNLNALNIVRVVFTVLTMCMLIFKYPIYLTWKEFRNLGIKSAYSAGKLNL